VFGELFLTSLEMTRYTKAEDVVPGDFMLNHRQSVKVVRVDRSDTEIVLHLSNGKKDVLRPKDNVVVLEDDRDD